MTETIKIYSKPNCGKCQAAKEKIVKLGYQYEEHELAYHYQHHEGWRINGSVDLLAWAADTDKDIKTLLPTIQIGNEFFDYSGAMKKLKENK